MLGAVIYAVAFQFFMFPNAIVAGGVTGIAMIINAITHWPVGVMIIVMNVPLFLISWRHFGLEYMLASLLGMGLSSVLVDLFAASDFVATTDPMLAAIIGGVIKGVGLGIIYYQNLLDAVFLHQSLNLFTGGLFLDGNQSLFWSHDLKYLHGIVS